MSGFRKLADTFAFEGNSGPRRKASTSGSAASAARREGVDRMIDQLRDVGRSLRSAERVPPELMSLYRQVSRAAYSFRAEEGIFLAAAIAAEPILRAILNDQGSTAAARDGALTATEGAALSLAGQAALPQAIVQTIATGMAPIAPLAGLTPALAEMRDVLLSSAGHLAGMIRPDHDGSATSPATPVSHGGGARSITPVTTTVNALQDMPTHADGGDGATPSSNQPGGDPLPVAGTQPDVALPPPPASDGSNGPVPNPDPAPEPGAVTTPDITPAPLSSDPVAPDITPAPPVITDPRASMGARLSLNEGRGPSGANHLDSVSQRMLSVTDGTLQQVRLSVSAEGARSGLTALDGSDLLLHSVSGQVVEGRLADGTVVFTIRSADDGTLSVELDAPILHGASGSGTDAALTLARNVLSLSATLRGGDGTTHQQSFDLGPMIEIRDDAPGHRTNPGGPELGAGADGGEFRLLDTGAPSGFTYRLDANGDLTVLQRQGGQDVAVRKISLVADQWQVTTLAPVHFAANQGLQDIDLPIRYCLTDGDGDRVEESFSLHFSDSQPDITLRTISLTERFGTQTVQSATAFTANDGVAGAAWDATMTAPAGFRYVPDTGNGIAPPGTTLRIEQSQNGNWVTVMTLTLDPATGTVNATQNARLLEDGSNGGHTLFGLDFTVTDRDGDTASGHVDLDVTRLGVTFRPVDFRVTETGNIGRMDDAAFSWTRGLQSGSWLTTGAPAGFTYVLDAGDVTDRTLLVKQNGQTVATLVLDLATGRVTLDHAGSLMHATGNGLNDQGFTLTYRLYDANGTFADSSVNLTFRDSVPVLSSVTENMTDSTAQTIGGALFSAADGVASARWSTANAPAGVTYVLDPADASGRTLLIQQGGVTRMTATLDPATGRFSIVQSRALDHGGLASLGLDLGFDVTDRDGDRTSGTLRLNVADTRALLQSSPATFNEGLSAQTLQVGQIVSDDGVRSLVWSTQGAPAGFTYTVSGNQLLVKQMQGTTQVTVMTFTHDPATGRITATTNAPIDHATNGTSEVFTVNYTVTDGDGSTTNATVQATVNDGAPGAPTLTFAPTSLTDGQTYNGTWASQRTGDRIVSLEISYGGQTRTVDLSNSADFTDFTVDGIRFIFRANGTFTLSSNVTRDILMNLDVGLRDADGDITVTRLTRPVDFVNIAPTGTSNTIFLPGRNNYTVQLADLGFRDTDGNSLNYITLTANVTNSGKLMLNGVQAAIGTQITLQDILTGKLVLVMPASATVGSRFNATFTVTDDGGTLHGGRDTSVDFDVAFAISNSVTVTGTSGDDTYVGNIPVDNYNGGTGNDTIRGGGGNDILSGGIGNDTIYGDDGNDTIHGDDDDDMIYGGIGDDTLYGDEGNDTIYGEDGGDSLYGGGGNDVLYGGIGDDWLRGGDGDDIMYGGTGYNVYLGGAGADTIVLDASKLTAGARFDWITAYSFSDGDVLDLTQLFTALPSVTDIEAARWVRAAYYVNGLTGLQVAPTPGGTFTNVIVLNLQPADEEIRVKWKDTLGNFHYDTV